MTTKTNLTFTNLANVHRHARKGIDALMETLREMEGQLVSLPENWLLLHLDSQKGQIISQVVFPEGVRAANTKHLQKWIEHELMRTAIMQTCYYCSAAFQNRASTNERLYMWCTHCGFSCFNWKINA